MADNFYTSYREYMQSGDLVEFRSKSLLGSAIRKITGEDVNHSAVVLRIDEYKHIKDRVFLIEAMPMGVELTAFSERLEGYDGEVYWYSLKATQEQRDIVASFVISLASRKRGDKRYDYFGFLKNIFGPTVIDTSTYFCSEVYHASLMVAGILPARDICIRPGGFSKLGVHEVRHLIYKP